MPDPSRVRSRAWRPDILEGFECRDLYLSAPPLEGEPDVPLTSTLLRRTLAADPDRDVRDRAVLHVHGWNDYFFHTHVAEFFEAHGFTLYAIDLRRHGRAHTPGQFANYVDDLADYGEELDLAYAVLAEHHRSVSVMAHSTGGVHDLTLSPPPARDRLFAELARWLTAYCPPTGCAEIVKSPQAT